MKLSCGFVSKEEKQKFGPESSDKFSGAQAENRAKKRERYKNT